MHLVLVLQQVVLRKITLNFITQYCVVSFTCNNFARKLLIRSLVSILHNLFSIYRTAYFILSTISDQNKKPVFWRKKILVSPSFVSFYMRPRFNFLPHYPLHFLIPYLMIYKNTEYMFFTIKVCQELVSNPRPLTLVYL